MARKAIETIVAVDDDPDDRYFMEKSFRKCGVEEKIIMLIDGSQAIHYLKGDGIYGDRKQYPYPTLILLDLKMPNVNGLEVLDYINKNPDFSIVPRIVLTGSSDTDDIKKAYELGASSYFVKPNSLEDLHSIIESLVGYWSRVLVPEVDFTGRQKYTKSEGKIGESFPQRIDYSGLQENV